MKKLIENIILQEINRYKKETGELEKFNKQYLVNFIGENLGHNLFVSLSDFEYLKINPNYKWNTLRGIYGFQVSHGIKSKEKILMQFDNFAQYTKKFSIFFKIKEGFENKIIFANNWNDIILNDIFLNSCIEVLVKYQSQILTSTNEDDHDGLNPIQQKAKKLILNCKSMKDVMALMYGFDSTSYFYPGWKTPDQKIRYFENTLVKNGLFGIVDGGRLLTYDYQYQACFFSKECLTELKTFINPNLNSQDVRNTFSNKR